MKDKTIKIRLTNEEYQNLKIFSKNLGMSEYIRKMLFSEKSTTVYTKETSNTLSSENLETAKKLPETNEKVNNVCQHNIPTNRDCTHCYILNM